MKPIRIPANYNYIAVFLTFACNLKCGYCINNFEQKLIRRKVISGKDFVLGLNRIISRDDLPVTLQGGEPTLHPDFYYIVNNLKPELNIDILTNLQFDVDEFIRKVDPARVKRDSPYASIRISYHPEQMKLDDLIRETLKLRDAKFSVGIWGVLHPASEKAVLAATERCKKLGIDFRTKEFLGKHEGRLYGMYRYPGACDGKFRKKVKCRTTELLIDSEGSIFRCHADLYSGKNKIGSFLDPEFEIEDEFRDCSDFGHCNPCDVKVKTNRFQQYGHTSVEIEMP